MSLMSSLRTPMDPNCSQGIPANPDVAGVLFLSVIHSSLVTDLHGGIGVRLSIYLQVLLPIVPQLLALVATPLRSRTKSTIEDVRIIMSASPSILVLGVALLLSAVIQARTIQLTAYHATLVLNYCWLLLLASNGAAWFVETHFLDDDRDPQSKSVNDTSGAFLVAICGFGSLMSIFGVVFWATLNHFDKLSSLCTAVTVQSILFHDHPLFLCRKAWLGIYGILTIPLINIVTIFVVCFLLGITPWAAWVAFGFIEEMNVPALVTGSTIMLKAMFITDTELTIAHNHVQAGEDQWTLGQTLTLFMVLPTLLKTWKDSKTAFRLWKNKERRGKLADIEAQLKSLDIQDQSAGAKTLAELSDKGDCLCSSTALLHSDLTKTALGP